MKEARPYAETWVGWGEILGIGGEALMSDVMSVHLRLSWSSPVFRTRIL